MTLVKSSRLDLYLALGSTVVGIALVYGSWSSGLLAPLLVAWAPGYVVIATLFPATDEISWVERIGLSLALSLALVPLLGVLLNILPGGLSSVFLPSAVAAFNLVIGVAAYWRRMRLPAGKRLSFTISFKRPSSDNRLVDRLLTLVMMLAILVATGALAFILLTPRTGERFTEFYILDGNGTTAHYPTHLNISQVGAVTVGVVNHEAAFVDYSVRILLFKVLFVYNASAGFNETLEVNGTTLSWLNLTLANSQRWSQRYAFQIESAGFWDIRFSLSKDGSPTSQELHLHLRIE